MPKIRYSDKRLNPTTLKLVEQANKIIREYTEQGFRLTLRQLYYQFVARDMTENTTDSYRRLGKAVVQGRTGGLIDWEAIEDRTRNVVELSHWDSPDEIVQDAVRTYRLDKWSDQPCRVEVLIEKEALAGVIEQTCATFDVPYLACKGYLSQSEMWRLAQRVLSRDQPTVLLHMGDHDPSGIDMTRNIRDELKRFGCRVTLNRIALNMDQVEERKPPPSPAKNTDSRFDAYVSRFGNDCWELDALDPGFLNELLEAEILTHRDSDRWARQVTRERGHVKKLRKLAGWLL